MKDNILPKWIVIPLFFALISAGCNGTSNSDGAPASGSLQLTDRSSSLPLASGSTSAMLSVETDLDATCRYSTVPGTAYADMTDTFGVTGSTVHQTTVSGLSDGVTSIFYVRCIGLGGEASAELSVSFSVNMAGSYQPPIGIPAPGFGIEESYRMYDDPTDRNPALTYTVNSEGGYYTHYIDNSGCSDSSNPYGNESTPRCSLPDALEAGSVVEVHGVQDGNQRSLTFNCSAAQPCWLRGQDALNRATIRRELIIKGAYVILENLHYDEGDTLGFRAHNASELHHAAVRHSELSRVGIYGHAGYAFNNIVVYSNDIHLDNFTNLGAASPEFAEHDTHGVGTGSYSEYIWILNNDIHDVAGDAVGNAHNANYTARYYFIGGNDLHDTGENAVDFKEIENLVVSQNKAYRNYGPSSGSDGTAMVFHYGPTYSPRNTWILFNEIYDGPDTGIQIGGSVTDPVYVIGNIIHDISNPSGTGYAVRSWSSADIYLLNNTLYGNDGGISITGDDTHVLTMINNIVAENINPDSYHLELDYSSYRNNAITDNNLFYQPGLSARINWGQVYDVAALQSATGKCSGCLEDDPEFTGHANIAATSPAVNAGLESSVYDDFATFYGLQINYDCNGIVRPSDSIWDIGACEQP